MNNLWHRYENKLIADTTYLKLADSVAAAGYAHAGYYNSLQHYRHVAFALKHPNPYRESYYRHLVLDAMVRQQTGRSIYYARKITEEAKKTRANLLPEITMSSFLLGTYIEYNSYEKVAIEYRKVLPQLEQLPRLIQKDSVNTKSVEHGLKSIAYAMASPQLANDSTVLRHAMQVADNIYNASLQSRDAAYRQNIPGQEYFYYLIQFLYYKHFPPSRMNLAFEKLALATDLLRSPKYRELNGEMAVNILSEVYMLLANEYVDIKNTDSAVRYLKLYNELSLDTAISAKKSYYHISAKIEAIKGNYKTAYYHLDTAYEAEYEHVAKVISDQNDNLYAQAEAEDQKELLDETMEQKKASEERIRLLIAVSLGLVAVAILLPLYLRQRQRARFLDFKLNMARNLHDETNPALLYAKALAKSNRETDANGDRIKTELEQHIEHTMETIRNLSHDLKSKNLHTVAELSKTVATSLKKLDKLHDFSYKINDKSAAKNFLSHQQFTSLKAILLECISNSIKHASFNKIDIIFHAANKKLHITYSDNGIGWPADQHKKGIGLENLQERSEQLNSELLIENNHPNGFTITIIVPLR